MNRDINFYIDQAAKNWDGSREPRYFKPSDWDMKVGASEVVMIAVSNTKAEEIYCVTNRILENAGLKRMYSAIPATRGPMNQVVTIPVTEASSEKTKKREKYWAGWLINFEKKTYCKITKTDVEHITRKWREEDTVVFTATPIQIAPYMEKSKAFFTGKKFGL